MFETFRCNITMFIGSVVIRDSGGCCLFLFSLLFSSSLCDTNSFLASDVFYLDTDGFVIPNFGIGDSNSRKTDAPEVDPTPSSLKVRCNCLSYDWETTT